jgi:glutathione peroxidase
MFEMETRNLMSDLQRIPLKTIDDQSTSLAAYAGKVLLVVNTASKCGLTPQYAELEALYTRYRDEGFVVLGFPSNDFSGQEPGSDSEVASFCSTNYAVDFPLFSKVRVVGAQKHPLYASLIAQQPKAADSESFREKLKGYKITPNAEPEVLWNFEKFLIAKGGRTVARFSPDMAPDDARLVNAIENELKA